MTHRGPLGFQRRVPLERCIVASGFVLDLSPCFFRSSLVSPQNSPSPRSIVRLRRSAAWAVLLFITSMAHGERVWLPAAAEDGLTQQLVAGFAKANVAVEASDEERVDAARKGIGRIAERLETMGVDGVLSAVPTFEGLEIPPTGSKIVDAIASFGTCSLPLHFELAADDGERLYVALGEVTVILVSAFLRHEYLRQGGSDEDLARLLNTEEFAAFSLQVQQEEDLRASVNSACAGPLGMLMQ